MNEIIEKTRELGELIQNFGGNAKYQLGYTARDMQNNKISREEAIQKNNEAFEEMLEKSESIKKYIDAKKEFDAMVNQVNQMLNFYITGQDPNCTHDCSTCGGCH